jgi:hypothetical protein
LKQKKWNHKLCQKQAASQASGILACVIALMLGCFPVQADEWDLSEDGKNWMYYDYSGEPVKDEWIEDKGKTYYLDSNGNMKIGWVTNKDDGNQYYMGQDGAMVTNAFTPDGRYVGPDGVIVKAYDTYRKKVKTEIKNGAKKTSSAQKSTGNGKKSGSSKAVKKQQYFLLTDLNQDGYRDLVIMEREMTESEAAAKPQGASQTQTDNQAQITGQDQANSQDAIAGGTLLEIAVWDTEEETFQLAAEFDAAGEGERSALYLDAQGQGVWLEIADDEENFRLFQLETDTSRFENRWNFHTQLDEWGGLEYYLDQDAVEKEIWTARMTEAKQQRGMTPLTGYLPITDETITEQVDRPLTEEDLRMWQE